MSNNIYEPMLDMFIFETTQLLEQLEQIIINNEKSSCYDVDSINEIFRIMHTIKGSAAMMSLNNISTTAHCVEDLFQFLREEEAVEVNYSELSDIVLESIDFIKVELDKVQHNNEANGDASFLINKIKNFLTKIKGSVNKAEAPTNKNTVNEKKNVHKEVGEGYNNQAEPITNAKSNFFKAVVHFEEACGMENLRAHILVEDLKDIAYDIRHIPEDVDDNGSIDIIKEQGFQVSFKTDCSFKEVNDLFSQVIFLKDLELIQMDNNMEDSDNKKTVSSENSKATEKELLETNKKLEKNHPNKVTPMAFSRQSMISVNINKLDRLMDLVGELVISESMVTQNLDLAGLTLDNFQKAAIQHRKIISELQDVAMSIRMVPLSTTFHKMNRIIRDMSKKLDKDVQLEIIGEETEADKNIIEHISDPLIHLIRNAIDHGIESEEERLAKGKNPIGKITLEAKNAGGDVLIIVKDDGRGLDKEKIYKKAKENGLIDKDKNQLMDKEIYSYIFAPGFSTKDSVTEFSGRGVGMDVVSKSISAIGGTIYVDSIPQKETTITIKIPLTLAIINGMKIRVGKFIYTIPITNIRESFKAEEKDIIVDLDGNEMIIIRGQCYPIIRLYEFYKIKTDITKIRDGIMVMVENEGKGLCLFVDELIGEQQVVVKALPKYIKRFKKTKGLEGCTLLGDGSISLILNIADFFEN